MMTRFLQFLPEVLVAVEFAIHHEVNAIVFVLKRLVSGVQIDDA